MKFFSCCMGVVVTAFLSGCAAHTPVKDVMADPQAHLASNFNETKLSESVRQTLGIKAPGKVKRQVQVESVMTNIDRENRQNFDKTSIFYVLDNGLVRSMIQSGNNGILSLTEFELSYHDIFDLIYQSMSHSATSTFTTTYTKSISRLDKDIAKPKENTEYVFEYALAPETQIMNFSTQKTVCKTGKWFAASTVHAKLTGLALPIDCEYFGTNGQTFLKMQSTYIPDLGISLKRESSTSTRKRTWTVTDIK